MYLCAIYGKIEARGGAISGGSVRHNGWPTFFYFGSFFSRLVILVGAKDDL